jgi:hypothetical protein
MVWADLLNSSFPFYFVAICSVYPTLARSPTLQLSDTVSVQDTTDYLGIYYGQVAVPSDTYEVGAHQTHHPSLKQGVVSTLGGRCPVPYDPQVDALRQAKLVLEQVLSLLQTGTHPISSCVIAWHLVLQWRGDVNSQSV